MKITFTIALLFVGPAPAAPQPDMSPQKPMAVDVILPGDDVKLSVYREPDLNLESKVASDGKINPHLVGPISLAGMTVREAEVEIKNDRGQCEEDPLG
tara:strand:+ start:249 stop:542 length:294 start_codon:yes stop_codon:yes gene_type:complete